MNPPSEVLDSISVRWSTVPVREIVLFTYYGELYRIVGTGGDPVALGDRWRTAFRVTGPLPGGVLPASKGRRGVPICMKVGSEDPDTGDVCLGFFSEDEQGEIIPKLIENGITDWRWSI